MSKIPRIAIQSVAVNAFVGVGTALLLRFMGLCDLCGKRLVRSITNVKKADL